MVEFRSEFDTYRIYYYTSQEREKYKSAQIWCYKGGQYAGRIIFYRDGLSLPQNALKATTGSIPQPELFFYLSQFSDVITMIREEKPLYLYYNDANNNGTLGTGQPEPVGEEEGK